MAVGTPAVVVAGHICLDIIPAFGRHGGGLAHLLKPGTLVEVGPVVLSTGGAVANTGLALHRLGVPTRLMGKVGDDLFGDAILRIIRRHEPALAAGMLVARGEPSSYTVVINPPGVDRVFLHCPGANDTFSDDDIPYGELAGVRLFHLGYPPVMRRFFTNGGAELELILRRVKERGVATSLDMSRPDPASESGHADWRAILTRTLPHVDVFLPSLEEVVFMLDRALFDRLSARGDLVAQCDGVLLADIAAQLLAMNVGVVALKFGDRGLYVRTTDRPERLAALRTAAGYPLSDWPARELLTPCFEVEVAGTTGCGDSTIAGFLAGLLSGLALEETVTAAVAVGACCAERPDATSGIQPWAAVQARVQSGWQKRPTTIGWPGWKWDEAHGVAHGPHDHS